MEELNVQTGQLKIDLVYSWINTNVIVGLYYVNLYSGVITHLFTQPLEISLYRSLTGQNPSVGISSLPLSKKLLSDLHTEASLMAAFCLSGYIHLEDADLKNTTEPQAQSIENLGIGNGGGKMTPFESEQ